MRQKTNYPLTYSLGLVTRLYLSTTLEAADLAGPPHRIRGSDPFLDIVQVIKSLIAATDVAGGGGGGGGIILVDINEVSSWTMSKISVRRKRQLIRPTMSTEYRAPTGDVDVVSKGRQDTFRSEWTVTVKDEIVMNINHNHEFIHSSQETLQRSDSVQNKTTRSENILGVRSERELNRAT